MYNIVGNYKKEKNMIDIVEIIANEFEEREIDKGRVKRNARRKIYKEDKRFDEFMAEKLNVKEHALYLKHEDDIVWYWTQRELELIKFTLQFCNSIFSNEWLEGKKKV